MKRRQADAKDRKTICLAGNPNVGKSTVFNALTGARQHTGNWAGKTVSNAKGSYMYGDTEYTLVDLPGTYSLLAQSAEEVVARDFICFGGADVVVVVCDATCLERNCNLALQILEITGRVVVCVNLMDEAEKKKIAVNISELEKQLGVPVVATAARGKKGLEDLRRTIDAAAHQPPEQQPSPRHMRYIAPLEEAVALLEPAVRAQAGAGWNSRWAALRLLDDDPSIVESLGRAWGKDILQEAGVAQKREEARRLLAERGIPQEQIKDKMVSCFVITAEGICADCVQIPCCGCHSRDRKIDRILTSKATGIPIMLLLLMAVFWITITGANYPSQILSDGLFWVQDRLTDWFAWMDAPQWLHGALVLGVYRVLAWVVSVMLPPMAIFFPLFTLLEDFGYLPRIAFNLDKYFQKAHACGKQALTMCMGFGCNAVGITGCRIIDSPRERLIAMLTNSFVPCNGRFPTILAMISMFFVGTAVFPLDSLLSTAVLTGVILLGIGMTFLVSWILSKTILKGVPSSFTLELPPYRRPQFGKVIVRSVLDRTIFVLGRGGSRRRTCRAAHLDPGQCHSGRGQPAFPLRGLFGSLRPLVRDGRRDFAGIYPGVPGQRDCDPHPDHGIPFHRDAHRFFQLGPVAGPAGFPWMDVADGGLFYSVLAYALAVLHLLPDGPKGNQKLEMDADFLCGADRHGICRVLSGGCHGPALRFGALVTANPPALCEPGIVFRKTRTNIPLR